jgi:branched-chain amino acid transport system substrate-binding protein
MKSYLPTFLALVFIAFSANAEDLKIGTTLSLSGAYATYGTSALHGIEMAVNEVNAQGGVNGRKIKLIVEDEGTLDLRRAATAAVKLITVDKVEVLLPLIVEDSEVIIPFTTKAPMFTMVVGCGAKKCGFNLGKFNVRAPSSHDSIIEKLVEHAKNLKISKPCIVAAESTYFEPYGQSIKTSLEKLGLDPEFQGVPLSNSEDYRDIATRFRAKQCDAIFAWIPMGSIGPFFRRVRE